MNMMDKYDLSVLILIYNQELSDILLTLESCLRQESVSMQIILADDGSEKTYLKECSGYMERHGFTDYKLVYHGENVGTVSNYYDALREADGFYIKSLGPGDCFSSDQMAEKWIRFIRQTKCQLSFSDVTYYSGAEGQYMSVQEVAHPQFVKVYQKKKKLGKKHYLLHNDIFSAVSILCEREILRRYTGQIVGKVRYAEDNMFRLMAFDGLSCSYFSEVAVYYEWGTGVSTASNMEFHKAIMQDWSTVSQMIVKRCGRSIIDRLIRCAYRTDYDEMTLMDKLLKYITNVERNLYNKRKKRLTNHAEVEYLYILLREVEG